MSKRKCIDKLTLILNSSVESHEPIFNNAVKAGAAADPNSKEEDSNGSNWSSKNYISYFAGIIILDNVIAWQ